MIVKEQIDSLFESEATDQLRIVVMYQSSIEYKAHVIEELKNSKVCPRLDDSDLREIYRTSNQNVILVVSKLAGLGKTHYIHS